MKTDINSILKKGAKTKIKYIDYSTEKEQKELLLLKAEAEKVLKNKDVSQFKMSQIIINR